MGERCGSMSCLARKHCKAGAVQERAENLEKLGIERRARHLSEDFFNSERPARSVARQTNDRAMRNVDAYQGLPRCGIQNASRAFSGYPRIGSRGDMIG